MAAAQRKVTLFLPENLLKKAQESTGEGITPTIRRGLELLAAQEAYDGLRSLRGKLDLELELKELRRDRR